MRKTFTTVAFAALLGTLAVSCQKENILNEPTTIEQNSSIYMVRYSIDGVMHQLTLSGDDAWHDFLNYMFGLAEVGHKVSFQNEKAASRTIAAKEIVTYTTTNHDDAYKWAENMGDNGYKVTIYYDKEKKVYYCEACK